MPEERQLWVGDVWRPIIEVENEAGVVTEPAALACKVRKPDDTEEVVAAANIAPGKFQPTIPLTAAGPWTLLPNSTTPTAAGKLTVQVLNR